MLHHARRVTYAEGYPPSDPAEPAAVAAIRVFAEFTDLLAGRRLTVVLPADDTRVAAVRAELGDPGWLAVERAGEAGLLATLRGSGAFKMPVFAFLDAAGGPPPDADLLAAVASAPLGEVLVALDPGPDDHRAALRRAGFRVATRVELADDAGRTQLLLFAGSAERSLDRFKDALWAVDEYAGIRYRDPADPERAPLDISLRPHLGPLRRALLHRLAAAGAATVADLREHTRAETIYRTADANRALTALLSAGTLTRSPERGRLTAETTLRLA
jgi:hypothetical protein